MKSNLICVIVILFSFSVIASQNNSNIVWKETNCELVIYELSNNLVQLVVSPIDKNGQAATIPFTAALIDYKTKECLRIRELIGKKEIKVGNMSISLQTQPLKITVHRKNGTVLQEFLIENNSDGNVSFEMGTPIFGLGGGDQQFDRRGYQYEMINGQRKNLFRTNGTIVPVPFLTGLNGWSMFVRCPLGKFDLRGDKGIFMSNSETNKLDPLVVYLWQWDKPIDMFTEYYHLTGKPAMPPKWTMGYIQSHRTLLGPDDALQIAKTFRDKNLPIDAVIYLGTGYCPLGWNMGNGTLEYNPKSFPNPDEQIKALHNLNLKIVLHITQAPKDLFGTSLNDTLHSPNYIGNYWKRHLPIMAQGIDGWWPDDGDNLPIEARLARHRCYYEGCRQVRSNERPWSLHRNGYAGVPRFGGWMWSGDISSSWKTLETQVPVGITSSMSLSPFWGTDIGGFFQTPELTGELYTRWFQFGTFNPLFRSHGKTSHLHLPWGWNTGETGPLEDLNFEFDTNELHNAQVEPICKQYLELRYRLLPYNYTLFRHTVDSGIPPMRALWMYYANDDVAAKLGDEFLWGRDFLISPVVEKGATNRRLYLPEGAWYDWWTNTKQIGKQWINRTVDLATMPIFVRAGAIIPIDPIRQYTWQQVSEPTTIRIYPGDNGSYTLYNDDGKSYNYLSNSDSSVVWINFQWNDKTRQLEIKKNSNMTNWNCGKKSFIVELLGEKPQTVVFEGKTKSIQL